MVSRKTIKKIEQDFEAYKRGLARLKELEKELNSLNTVGFEKDEKKIRKKLKSVHLIPEIEKDLEDLKLKIEGKYTPVYKKTPIDKKQEREIKKLAKEEEKLKCEVRKAKELTKEEKEDIEKIPVLRRKISALEKELERTEKLARSAKELTKEEKEEVKNLPLLREELNRLREILRKEENAFNKKIGALEKEEEFLDYETEKIPKIQRKVGFLSRLFKKEDSELKELSSKVDKNKLDFYNKLTQEVAEAKRMIEEEKYALREQLLNLLAESIRNINKEKEASDKKILEEIENLKFRLEENKKNLKEDINKDLISKIVQLKKRIDESKEEMRKSIDEQLGLLKSEIKRTVPEIAEKEEKEKEKKKETKQIFKKLLKPLQLTKLPEIKTPEELPEFPTMQLPFSSHKLSQPLVSPQASLPQTKEPSEFPSIKTAKPIPTAMMAQRVIPMREAMTSFKREQAQQQEQIIQEIQKPTKLKLPKRKIRIPKSIFFRQDEFAELYNDINTIKKIVSEELNAISKDTPLNKELYEKELTKFNSEIGKIRENISKFLSVFPSK